MRFKFGSFNVMNMSWATTDDKKRFIADLIRKEQFDVVAFQEVLSEGKAIRDMKKKYFPTWGECWGYPKDSLLPGKMEEVKDKRGEGFSYIWNTRRVKLASNKGKVYEPRILNQDGMKFDGSKFIRVPYYIRFIPVYGGFFEFRLINVHLYFGNNNKSEIEKRKEEYNYLVKNVYPSISMDRTYGNNREAYTIIMGDYNLNLYKNRGEANEGIIKNSVLSREESVYLNERQSIITVQHELTSLKSNEDLKENKKTRGYSQNYDHFTFDVKVFEKEGIQYKAKKIDAVRRYYDDDFEEYRTKISDHVPISLELIMNEPMVIMHK